MRSTALFLSLILLAAGTAGGAGDPPGPALAEAQLAAGDKVAAHLTFKAWILNAPPNPDPGAVARAATNAVAVGDAPLAFIWAHRVDPKGLPAELRRDLLLARLKASHALSRMDEARRALADLESIDPEAIRLDPLALFAAARVDEASGLLESAAARYQQHANLHLSAPERPQAMAALVRLRSLLGERLRGETALVWMEEEYPDLPLTRIAALERIDLGRAATESERVSALLDAARKSPDANAAREACRRALTRLKTRVGPLEAIAALSALARESEGLGPLAAREALLRSVDPLLGPLAEAGDEVQLVAAASELESAGIPLPTRNLAAVTAARLRLGLPGIATSPLETAIAAARERAREGLWAEAAETLRAPITGDRTASPLIRAEAHLFFAESLWRQGDTRGALEEIGRALKLPLSPKDARAGRVLRGDILFASGRLEDACADYRGAIAVDSTPWVEQQVDRCDREEGSEG